MQFVETIGIVDEDMIHIGTLESIVMGNEDYIKVPKPWPLGWVRPFTLNEDRS
jgi:hypothetical protein